MNDAVLEVSLANELREIAGVSLEADSIAVVIVDGSMRRADPGGPKRGCSAATGTW